MQGLNTLVICTQRVLQECQPLNYFGNVGVSFFFVVLWRGGNNMSTVNCITIDHGRDMDAIILFIINNCASADILNNCNLGKLN